MSRDPDLRVIVERSLRLDPGQRYATPRQLRCDLSNVVSRIARSMSLEDLGAELCTTLASERHRFESALEIALGKDESGVSLDPTRRYGTLYCARTG